MHQNREKWVPERADKHSSMREKVERDLAQPGGGVCQKCRDVIQWKKDYGKYKPLRAPAKCTHCNQRVITHAYHMLCLGCANFKNVCAKCGEDRPLHEEDPFDGKPKPPSPDELALMNERQRRTAIRKYEKALDDEKAAKRAALQGITVEELRQREAAEREARGQPIAELVQDVDKMLHPKLFRAAPPPTAPPVAPAPPRPTATTAESMYASLEKMGQPASLCAPVDASDQARWSDRDNEGRTDDEDADLLNMESTRLGNQSRVAAAKASVPVAKTGRKSKASVINDDDDAAVEAVEAEAASDEDEDDDDDDDDDEDEEEDDDEEEDEDEEVDGAAPSLGPATLFDLIDADDDDAHDDATDADDLDAHDGASMRDAHGAHDGALCEGASGAAGVPGARVRAARRQGGLSRPAGASCDGV